MSLTIYHNPRCRKSREAIQFLEGKGISLNIVKYLDQSFDENSLGEVLKKIDMKKIDFVFLDGGHDYHTVVNDLNYCKEVVKLKGVVLCDDYNLGSAPGVKKAIDEFVDENKFKCEIMCENRFAKIQLN